VLRQGWGRPLASERQTLNIKRGERAVIREVRLMCGERPWVFARTVIPVRSLRGAQRRLAHLGSKPLGAALFADPHVHRGEVEVAHIGPDERLFARAVGTAPYHQAIWGRRSVFWSQGKSLLVSEIFLPALFQGQAQDCGDDHGVIKE
jgi:chorismate--pyruvate lyase